MAGSETLSFNILGNASSAAKAFRDTADSAALAARGTTMARDAMDLQAKSAAVSASATLALAKADKVLADAELSLARDMTVANAVMGRQATALLGNGTAGAVGAMLAAAASGQAPSGTGGSGGLAPGIAMAAAAMGIARKNTKLFSDSISQGTPVWDGARKGIFGLNGQLLLFGGSLANVGVPHILSAATTVHILTEAVTETAGTLIPAAIAFGAFSVAAVPTVQAIYTQMKNLYTISQATGTQIPGLSGGFSKMAAAVQPEVYTLFGEALVFANSGTGQLSTLATGAGKVLDDLGARFVYATTQGKGFSTFASKATSDLSAWGNNIGNLGGIIGNLLKVLPGYAEDLASVFGGVTHAIEVVTGSSLGQWVLSIGIAAHGAVFYIGLLGTGFAKLASVGLSAIASGLGSAAIGVSRLGAAGAVAGDGLLAVAVGASKAAALPWGWIGIAAAGVGFLVYQMAQAKDETQQFYANLQHLVQNSSLADLSGTIAAAQAASLVVVAQRTREATAAENAYAQSQRQGISAAQAHAGYVTQQQSALQGTVKAQQEAIAGNGQLNAEYALVNSRIATLGKSYGGTAGALALLNAAGITTAQITDTNNAHWAQALIEIDAQNRALAEMNVNTGALGSSYVNTLLPAVQKVTGAQDALIGGITGGRSALDTFEQGIGTLTTNFDQVTGSGATVNETLGKLKATASLAGASLAGTSQGSYALNQAFYTEVQNGQKLIDSLEAQGISQKNLGTVTATVAGQMLSFAGNNKEARSVVVSLINDALGPGTVSMQSLDKWTGKNSTTLAGLNNVIAQSTVAAGNLAGTLNGLLNSAFEAEILKASGADGATKAFADAIVKSGDDSSATKGARDTLIADLEKAGYSAKDATSYVDGLQQKVNALHGTTVPVKVVVSGSGEITAFAPGTPGQIFRLASSPQGLAAGGFVSGGQAGRDSVPAMLMPGEVVVPAKMVAGGAVDHLRGSLPGFAAGGIVSAGPWAAGQGSAAAEAAGGAWAQKLASAAVARAKAAAGTPVAYSKVAGVTQWEGDVSRVLSMLGLPQADLPTVMSQILTESGGNPNAINLTDVNAKAGDPSRGLMQVIGSTFSAYRSPALSPNIYDPLANIYAGVNYAVHAYGNPGWLGVLGHGHGYAGGTSSAAPGWAWVGERGPELMRFRGGEQVIPAQFRPRGSGSAPGGAGSRRLSADAQAIIAALEANTAAVMGQGSSVARSLNSVSAAAASRGSYSTRR